MGFYVTYRPPNGYISQAIDFSQDAGEDMDRVNTDTRDTDTLLAGSQDDYHTQPQHGTTSTAASTPPNSSDNSDLTAVFCDATQVLDVPSPHTEGRNQLKGTLLQQRYLLEDQIGRGGMCDIYRARDLLLEQNGIKDNHIAVKLLQPHLQDHPQARHLLIAEARKSQQLSHPNIIRVFSFGHEALESRDSACTFLVMEWLDGETLDLVIKRSRPRGLNYEGAMQILRQIAAALDYASSQGVVHADLKPSNVMLTRDGHIKVLDFGVAGSDPLHQDIYAVPDNDATEPVQGYTPAYASPQLLAGNKPTHRDDIYSFCCIAYELLTSKHPFQRQPADKAQQQKLRADAPAALSSKRWAQLKQGLAFEERKRPAQLLTLLNLMEQPAAWPRLAGWSAALVVVLAAAGMGYQQYQGYQQRLLQLDTRLADSHRYDYLQGATPTALLDALAQAPADQQALVTGILQQQRARVLDYFEGEVESQLQQQQSGYPDYYSVTRTVEEGLKVFPDSARLHTLLDTLQQSWRGSTQALDEQLNAMLEQGKYQTKADFDNLLTQFSGLKRLNHDYQPLPSEKASATYQQVMQEALSKTVDEDQLNRLRKIGETFFAGMPVAEQSVEQVDEVQQAQQTMDAYKAARKQGQKLPFPHAAAAIVYQEKTAALASQISAAADPEALTEAENALASYGQGLPSDFEPLVTLTHQLAQAYRDLAKQLINADQLREAQKAMAEADLVEKGLQAR